MRGKGYTIHHQFAFQYHHAHEKECFLPQSESWHVMTRRLKQKLYKCPHCTKRYTKRWSMKRHCRAAHTGEPQPYYLCDFPDCNRLYRRKNDAIRHKRLHVVEKPALCNRLGCEFGSLIAHVLETHKREDHGSTPYVCKIVGCIYSQVQFVNEWQLLLHKQQHHTLEEQYYPLWCRTKLRNHMKQKQSDWEAFLAVRQQLYSSQAYSLHRMQQQQTVLPTTAASTTTASPPPVSVPISLLIHREPNHSYQRRRTLRCPVPFCSFHCTSYEEFDAHQTQKHALSQNMFQSFRLQQQHQRSTPVQPLSSEDNKLGFGEFLMETQHPQLNVLLQRQ